MDVTLAGSVSITLWPRKCKVLHFTGCGEAGSDRYGGCTVTKRLVIMTCSAAHAKFSQSRMLNAAKKRSWLRIGQMEMDHNFCFLVYETLLSGKLCAVLRDRCCAAQ